MSVITVKAPTAPIRAQIALPRSKSVANRALLCAALAGDADAVQEVPSADDTVLLARLLRDRPEVLHCGLGGTTLRFALAWAAVQAGEERFVTGDRALLERPHAELVQALCALGARIDTTMSGYVVKGTRLRGGEVAFDSPISSQYLSALMLVAPMMEQGLRITWRGTQLSRPYVEMTAQVMRRFGASVSVEETRIMVEPGRYTATPFLVPCDWSAAAFWFETVALAPDAEVELVGLKADGLQGDERVATLLAEFVRIEVRDTGIVLRSRPVLSDRLSVSIDLTSTPDLFQPLVFAFLGAGAAASFFGLHNLKVKETDRIQAVQEAVGQLTGETFTGDTQLALMQFPKLRASEPFAVHGDHRMAMALAPLALVCGSIGIRDPEVVRKSYLTFWDDLQRAGFRLER